MANIKVWAPLDMDELEEADKEVRSNSTSEIVKPQVGENVYRFVPRLADMKRNYQIVYEHFVSVPGRENDQRFVCPRRQTQGQEMCPECDAADKLRKSRNPVDYDRAKGMYPTMRVYLNVIMRDAEELGPRVLVIGKGIWDDLKKVAKSKHGGGDYTDPTENGFDIIIDRTGTGRMDTRYTVSAARGDSPLHEDPDVLNEWVEKQWPIVKYAVVLDAPTLATLLAGGDIRGGGGRREMRDGGSSRGAEKRQLGSGTAKRTIRTARRTAQDDVETGRTIDVTPPDDDDVPL